MRLDANIAFASASFNWDWDGTNFLNLGSLITTHELAVGSVGQFGGTATVAYSRFGSGVTGHSLGAANDLLISDDLEVDGEIFGDGTGSNSFAGSLTISKSLTAGNAFYGANLTDCDGDTQTLAWSAETGKFSCGDDDTGGGGVSSNSLDFDEIRASMSLDTFTDITFGTQQLSFNLDSAGDFLIQDNGVTFATFSDTGTFTLDNLVLDGTTLSTNTGTTLTLDANGAGGVVVISDDDLRVGGNDIQDSASNVRFTFSTAAGSPNVLITGTASASSHFSVTGSASFKGGVRGSGLTDCDGSTSKLLWDSTGAKFSCGTDQTGAGGGGVDGVTVTVFTANGTWTKANYTGLKFTEVITTAEGGGAGGADGGDTASETAAGGGGAGGTSIEMIAAASLGSTETVTVGTTAGGGGANTGGNGTAGANSSFGAHNSANGGSGGIGVTSTVEAAGTGGAGGTSSGGDVNLTGGGGTTGTVSAEVAVGGTGGASYWGGGAQAASDGANGCTAGNAGAAYGSGGSGARCEDSTAGAVGGAGANGIIVTINYTSSAGDLAEWYETKADVGAGDVVAIGGDSIEYNSRLGLEKTAVLEKAISGSSIVGVVSTDPFQIMGGDILDGAKHPKPIALAGRVPVKVSEENGKIKAGDLLTVSSTPGVAMRSTKAGVIIGRTLEDSDCKDGEMCMVLVMVHTSYTTGALLKVAFRDDGLLLDTISSFDPHRDIGRTLLAYMLRENKKITKEIELSETFTDRVVAGLEIISPRVIADTVITNKFEPANRDLELKLGENGKLIITNNASGSFSSTFGNTASQSSAVPVITFDNLGNAFFAGQVTANKISADEIFGIDVITNKISLLSKEIASVSSSDDEDGIFKTSVNEGLKIQNELIVAYANKINQIASSSDQLVSNLQDLASRILLLESVPGININRLLESEGSLSVSGITILSGGLSVDNISSAGMALNLISDTIFFGRPYFNRDTAGFALIKKDSKSVDIIFEQEYLEQPIVNANISLESDDTLSEEEVFASDIKYLVTRKSTKGFTIILNKLASNDIRFSWIALAVKSAKTFNSIEAIIPTLSPTPLEELNGGPSISEPSSPSFEEIEMTPSSTPEPTPGEELTSEPTPEPTPESTPESTPELLPEPILEPAPTPEGESESVSLEGEVVE